MKNLLLTITALCMFTFAANAQWRVIKIKPGAKVYANGKLIRKGSKISPKSKIKFSKKTDYMRVYAKGRAPFTLKPGGGRPGKGSELVAVATSMMVPRKRSLASRGEEKLTDEINDLQALKIWLTGTPPDKEQANKKAKKLLFIGNEGKLYIAAKALSEFNDKAKCYLVYQVKGKRAIKPLSLDEKDNLVTVSFKKKIYNGVSNLDDISRSAFFYKAPGNKPTPIAAFRPFFIDEPGDDFKAEVKELIPMLKETYGEAFIKKTTQELKKEGAPNPKKEAKTRAIEGRFYGISDLFEDTFGGVPDRNSLKMWLVKNFPKFKVPGKKD